jgi:hypothetical protein
VLQNRPDCGPREIIESTKSIVETLAYLLAALFFLAKWISGYFLTNLSVRISCAREVDPMDAAKDVLAVTLVLLKGDRGSLRIHDIGVRNNDQLIPEMANFREQLWRISYTTDKREPGKPKKIQWGTRSKSSPFITLGAGEETQLASYCKVGRNEICHVYVVLTGRRPLSPSICQWTASCVSFPNKAN